MKMIQEKSKKKATRNLITNLSKEKEITSRHAHFITTAKKNLESANFP